MTCVGIAVLGVVAVYQARPYLKVANEYPTAKRTLKEVKTYSSGPAALVSALLGEPRVGQRHRGRRAKRALQERERVLPRRADPRARADRAGGRGRAVYTRRLRLGLASGIVVCSVLAMGLGLTGAGYPYRLLYDYAPGWDGVRVPGRVFTLATLFYALLAGAGVAGGCWRVRGRLGQAQRAARPWARFSARCC